MKKENIYLREAFASKRLVLTAILFAVSVFAAGMSCRAAGNTYRVVVNESYLALRSAKAFERSNEIGELYTGDLVEVQDTADPTYWYVYSYKLDKYGYVNKNYLISEPSPAPADSVSDSGWTVKVDSGYLALRSAKAFDSSNEIGKLYTGDTVLLQDASDSAYWYVYSSRLDKYGYVNKDYLIPPASSDEWSVKVDSGYLALRSAKAFDSSNEIGKLYTGDTVQIQDASDPTYWYVYSSKLNQSGYVNKNYLIAPETVSGPSWAVSVETGYLALRTAKAFDRSNEIGELHNGDIVQVQDSSDPTYWYVYSSSLGKYGYVNRNYLTGPVSSPTSVTGPSRTVRVSDGYLALRSAKAFDKSNEIGKLYTGDTV